MRPFFSRIPERVRRFLSTIEYHAKKFAFALERNIDIDALEAAVDLSRLWLDWVFDLVKESEDRSFYVNQQTLDNFIDCAQFWTNVSKQLIFSTSLQSEESGADTSIVNCPRYLMF